MVLFNDPSQYSCISHQTEQTCTEQFMSLGVEQIDKWSRNGKYFQAPTAHKCTRHTQKNDPSVLQKKYVPLKHPQTQPECVYWNKLGIKTSSSGTKPTHPRDWQLLFHIWTANTHSHKFARMKNKAFCYAQKEDDLKTSVCMWHLIAGGNVSCKNLH